MDCFRPGTASTLNLVADKIKGREIGTHSQKDLWRRFVSSGGFEFVC
jgi:hypothetical protein